MCRHHCHVRKALEESHKTLWPRGSLASIVVAEWLAHMRHNRTTCGNTAFNEVTERLRFIPGEPLSIRIEFSNSARSALETALRFTCCLPLMRHNCC